METTISKNKKHRRIIVAVICILVFLIATGIIGFVLMKPDVSSTTHTKPPTLTVICGESTTQALQGTYSWFHKNWGKTGTHVEADCIHPLEAKELMEPLNLVPPYLSHIDTNVIYLYFEATPDSVEVSYWSEECWGRPEDHLKGTAVPVTKTEDTDADGNPIIIYSFKRGEETAIYQISAKWENYENFDGTADYSFYTAYPLLTPQLIEP